MTQDSRLEQLLIEASLKAGSHLREHAFDPGTIKWKGPNDPVTDRDTETEKIIIDSLCTPIDMKIIGEESGYTESCQGSSKYTAIIDPLDGTKSYLRGEFLTAVSIGIEEKDKLIAGAVYDFMRDLLYVGFRGETYVIHNSKKSQFQTLIKKPKVGIITNTDHHKLSEEDSKRLRQLEDNPRLYLSRRRGSIALALAHTAYGIHDSAILYNENSGNVWDVAAGIYLLQCTNHRITDIEGNPFNSYQASNGLMALGPRFQKEIQG
ncbi:hypothetical protein CL619_03585 [archaeon]|nr:hypothetical protein [archaeon]|tara:strand:+ start:1143 stop:1934 length:792 start_codon:yes stop_codon:yes gene_type:complete